MVKERVGKGKPSTRSRVLVLLERMEEQNRATAEVVIGLRREMNQRFDDLERRLTVRIEALELAVRHLAENVRQNTADIQKNSADIQKNSADIQKNSADIQKNSADIQRLDRRVQELAQTLAAHPSPEELRRLESRVTAIETKLGLSPPGTA